MQCRHCLLSRPSALVQQKRGPKQPGNCFFFNVLYFFGLNKLLFHLGTIYWHVSPPANRKANDAGRMGNGNEEIWGDTTRGLGKPQQPGIWLHCVEASLDPANRCVPFHSRTVVTAGPKFPSSHVCPSRSMILSHCQTNSFPLIALLCLTRRRLSIPSLSTILVSVSRELPNLLSGLNINFPVAWFSDRLPSSITTPGYVIPLLCIRTGHCWISGKYQSLQE